ncbi:MAG: FG-GAP-like repeat-containing protein [Mizugakiibacter sp.]|uniref:FG-GAP-like repeat-containing protein n=1 Tax=Mizugakiibacter sp. TaxID=1972610 RepID=UPI0031C9BA14|nr:FG-GAP-like repeat-containing protein [Xanthomonadaceae bacterium]
MRSILILAALLVLASVAPVQAKDRYLLGSSVYAQSVTVGIRKLYPATIDEDQAIAAAAEGSGLWVPLASGGRVYVKYVRNEVYANGDWSWIGEVATAIGKQSAVLTFGKDAVFGSIPMPSGRALHIVRHEGKAWVAQVDPALAAQSVALMANAVRRNDALAPPTARFRRGANTRLQPSEDTAAPLSAASAQVTASATAASATAASGPVVDVMIAYTAGFATGLGSDSAAQTRLNYLVAYANQTYVNSKVNLRIRLVETVKVSYPDNTLNDNALFDLSGFDDNGNSVTIPASLSTLPTLRVQYGADLVALVRKYDHATNGSCGIAWLNGAGAVGVVQDDYPAGMAVISDGTDAGYYCEDKALTHELGHTMGLAHDIANASKDSSNNPIPGAYAYSYGYKTSVSGNTGFGTIMAYEGATQESVQVFSSPNLLCQNVPCGVANQADNARTLNQTAATVATFEATKVPLSAQRIRNDVDNDGRSDILWRYTSGGSGAFGYWIMNGSTVAKTWAVSTGTGYHVAATGDFNGDGYLDIAWTSSSRDVRLWFGNGVSFSSSAYVRSYGAGWQIIGAGDIDGDGKSDLLFRYVSGSSGQFGYWIMNGSTVVRTWATATTTTYRVGATGDFNGDGYLDIAWTSAANDVKMWFGNGTSFSSSAYAGTFAKGWSLIGGGDVDGDGKTDLLFLYNSGGVSRFGYWNMNGSTVVRTWSTSVNPAYHVACTGDFNGDGDLDVAWTSNANDIQIWFGNGTSFTGNTYARSFGTGWTPIADTP